MKLLPDGRFEISNKGTGETRVVTREELPNYGLSAPNLSKVDASVPYEPTGFQKYGSFVEKNLPTIGAVGLPLAITALTGGMSAPATIPAILAAMGVAGAGAASGYGTQQAMRQLRGEDVISQASNPLEGIGKYYGGMATEVGGAAAGEAAGVGAAKLAGKILGPVASKLGFKAFNSPLTDKLKTSVEEIGKPIGREIGEAIEGLPQKGVVLDDTIKKLVEMGKQPYRSKDMKSLKNIQGVIDDLTGLDPVTAQALKTRYNSEIYGESGKELSKRGQVGLTSKRAKKLVTNDISSSLKKMFKDLGREDILKKYEDFSEISKMETKLQKQWGSELGILPTTLGALGFLSGNPWIGAGTTAAANLAAAPFSQLFLRKLFGSTVGATEIPLELLVNSLINAKE